MRYFMVEPKGESNASLKSLLVVAGDSEEACAMFLKRRGAITGFLREAARASIDPLHRFPSSTRSSHIRKGRHHKDSTYGRDHQTNYERREGCCSRWITSQSMTVWRYSPLPRPI